MLVNLKGLNKKKTDPAWPDDWSVAVGFSSSDRPPSWSPLLLPSSCSWTTQDSSMQENPHFRFFFRGGDNVSEKNRFAKYRKKFRAKPAHPTWKCYLFANTLFDCLQPKLWIEKTNDLGDIETDISRNLKGLVAIEIANAVVSPGSRPLFGFLRPHPAENESPIANR